MADDLIDFETNCSEAAVRRFHAMFTQISLVSAAQDIAQAALNVTLARESTYHLGSAMRSIGYAEEKIAAFKRSVAALRNAEAGSPDELTRIADEDDRELRATLALANTTSTQEQR